MAASGTDKFVIHGARETSLSVSAAATCGRQDASSGTGLPQVKFSLRRSSFGQRSIIGVEKSPESRRRSPIDCRFGDRMAIRRYSIRS